MKKIICRHFLVALLATFVITGCSSSQEPKTEGDPKPTSTNQEATGEAKPKGDTGSPFASIPTAEPGKEAPATDKPAVKTDKPAVKETAKPAAAGSNSRLVGKFKGEITFPASMKDDPNVAMAKSLLANTTLELNADKTFTMTMMVPLEGHWSVSGSTVSLKIEKMMGMDPADVKKAADAKQPGAMKGGEFDKPMKLMISDNGNKLTAIDEKGSDKGSLVFTKAK